MMIVVHGTVEHLKNECFSLIAIPIMYTKYSWQSSRYNGKLKTKC